MSENPIDNQLVVIKKEKSTDLILYTEQKINEKNNIENSNKRKRKTFRCDVSVLDKLEAIKRYENGETIKKISFDLKVTPASISYWCHNKEKLEKFLSEFSENLIHENKEINKTNNIKKMLIKKNKFIKKKRRSRTILPILEKLKAIERYENGERLKSICSAFKVNPKTIWCWHNNKEKYLSEISKNTTDDKMEVKENENLSDFNNNIKQELIEKDIEKVKNKILKRRRRFRYNNKEKLLSEISKNPIDEKIEIRENEKLSDLNDNIKQEIIEQDDGNIIKKIMKPRRTFKIVEKLEIIKRYENRELLKEICSDVKVFPSLIFRWYHDKEKLQKLFLKTWKTEISEKYSREYLSNFKKQIEQCKTGAKRGNVDKKSIGKIEKISISEKLKAIKRYEKGESLESINCDLKVTPRSIWLWYNNKEKLQKIFSENLIDGNKAISKKENIEIKENKFTEKKRLPKSNLPMLQKFEAIERYENGEIIKNICSDLKISRTAIFGWYQKKEKLQKLFLKSWETEISEEYSREYLSNYKQQIEQSITEVKNGNGEKSIKRKVRILAKIPIAEKLKAIKRYEKGESLKSINCDLKISPQTILRWYHSKEKLENLFANISKNRINEKKEINQSEIEIIVKEENLN